MQPRFWNIVQVVLFVVAVSLLALSLFLNSRKSSEPNPAVYAYLSYSQGGPTSTATPAGVRAQGTTSHSQIEEPSPDARAPVVPFTPLQPATHSQPQPDWELQLAKGYNLLVWPGDPVAPAQLMQRYPAIQAIVDPVTNITPGALETYRTYWFLANTSVTITP